jgi:predicted flap endonuclease-1-like 5' DNA nuclease
MAELISDNWVFFVITLAIGIVVAWWVFAASRKTRVERSEAPAEDTPARRNQALIDTPAANSDFEMPPPTPQGLAGAGEAVAAAAEPVHEQPLAADDLKRIKGVGPKLEKLLNSLGVTRYAQIAAWDDAEIDRIDGQLGTFQGRIRRDDWPAQARYLAAGDMTAFEARFGRL